MNRRSFLLNSGKTLGVGTLAFSTLAFEEACTVPSWVETAEGIVQDILPIAGSIVDLVMPSLAPLVTIVEAGFSAVLKAIQDVQAAIASSSPTASLMQILASAMTALNTDVSNLVSQFNLSGSTDAIIVGIIGLITQAVADLANILPKSLTKNAGTQRYLPVPNGWTGPDFTRRYNVLIGHDRRFKALPVTN